MFLFPFLSEINEQTCPQVRVKKKNRSYEAIVCTYGDLQNPRIASSTR